MDQELLNFITTIQNQESSTVTALENSVDLLISSLNSCIAKVGLNQGTIANYESNSFYTDKDVYALANISELFYQQHEDNKDVYDAICEAEQNLKDAAEERETQGVWKTVAGVVLVGVGVACIIATAGAASPIVAAVGVAMETGMTIYGVADSAEGAQDIYYGSIGDIDSTAVNDLKYAVFQGNEEAYYLTESVFAFAASAMIPIGQAASAGNLTFRSGATIVAKEGIATAAGAGAQKYTTDLTGNQTAGMLAGMAASMATAKGLNGIEAGAKKLAKPKLGDVGTDGGAVLNDADVGSAVKGGRYSNLGNMSFEDGKQYSSWSKLREEGLSLEQVEKIKGTPKGQKPLPETYLSEEYINNHLNSFKKSGAVKIMPSEPSGTIGGKGGTFVMSGDELSEIIRNADGDVAKIESVLGLDKGYLGSNPVIVTIQDTSSLRLPSGNELGAWPEYWEPGGYTSGGIKEAVINPAKEGTYTYKHLFE
ncbi:MAG: hypothetical protein ACLSHE_03910 [Roseburia sp.]